MNLLNGQADLPAFFAKEMDLVDRGLQLKDSLSNFQAWLCTYLSLMEDEKERMKFIEKIDGELDEILLIHKYRDIYGQSKTCRSTCKDLVILYSDYLRVKYGVHRAA